MIKLPESPYALKWLDREAQTIPLSIADMDVPTDPLILESIAERLRYPLAYPPPYTTDGLADRLADFFNERYGAGVSRDCFWLAAGAVPVSYLIFDEFLEPGNEALYFAPSYKYIPGAVQAAGATAVPVPVAPDHRTSTLRRELSKAVSRRTRAVYLCNPHNPTGHVFTRAELEVIAEFALRHKLRIVSDELHSRLVLDGVHTPIAALGVEVARISLTIDGPTKSHNLAGIGGAFVWSPDARAVAEIRDRLGHRAAPARALQRAVMEAAYRTEDSPWLRSTHELLRHNRTVIENFLRPYRPEVRYTPGEATYFGWLDFGETFAERGAHEVLAEHGLAVEPGPDFGAEHRFARITFAMPTNLLQAALDRLAHALVARVDAMKKGSVPWTDAAV